MTDAEIYENNLLSLQVISRSRNRAQCKCPAHDDKQASLTVSKGDKCTIFHCHAGCSFDDILAAAGLSKSDTYYNEMPKKADWKAYVEGREHRKIEAVYNYVSLNGGYAFTKIRLQGKKILYGTLENERFSYGLQGRTRKNLKAIYGNIQAINKAIVEGKPIFIPEGEKDVNTLVKLGYIAFTYGGVNDWQTNFSTLVENAEVFILADNDEAGKRVAETIQNDIKSVVKRCKIIVPMPETPKADITDYFNAGYSREEFEELLKHSENAVTERRNEATEAVNKPKLDLDMDKMQFHLLNKHNEPIGVFDSAIENYIIENQKLFIYGGIPFLYKNGCYFPDWTTAELSTTIREKIFDNFTKSTTLDRIYRLFLKDARIQKNFEEINTYPAEWICFKNGMYDPVNKKLLPHDSKYCCINQIPHEYYPERVPERGETIEKYLDYVCDSQQDLREMLLMYLGYCLTRDTRQQKFLIMTGEGGSGKSTLIKCFELLVGQRNISNVSLTDLQQRFSSIELMGMLVNSCADLEIGALTDVSSIKKLVGEDSIKGERKGKDLVFFKNYAKLIFSTNELPLIKSEKTNAFYRRLLVLPMSRVPERKDPDLFRKLEAEKDYLLMLAVKALEKMYEQGNITVAEASNHEIERLRADSDTVEGFILEECEKVDEYRVERTELYKKYSEFCKDNERQELTKNNFYKSLRLKGYEEATSCGKRYFLGLKTALKNCSKDEFITVTQEQLLDLPFS